MEDDSMIEEFKIEAAEMFENAEEGLLNIDKGLDFNSNYNSIFRSFHSLKGAAGMFGLDALQGHMHKLESLFEAQKKYGGMEKYQVDYFLKGIDAAKSLLDGNSVAFSHIDSERFNDKNNNASLLTVTPKKNTDSQIMLGNKQEIGEKKNGVVFIVDAEQVEVDSLAIMLELRGVIVHKFYNSNNLISSFESIRPDVVFVNMEMPDVDGFEILEDLQDFSTDTPIILTSEHITKDIMEKAFTYGVYDFIEKPYDDIKFSFLCLQAIKSNKSSILLEQSINYILYHFSSLDQYLKDQGKENIRLKLKTELQAILEQKKILKNT